MDPKQSLMLIFIMQKRMLSEKVLKKTPGINYSASNCKILSANFNSESKTSLFTDDDAIQSVVV